ncbi:MAG TPA: DoxX family protein [Gemmatimonadales bacterium]|nr:DoxX family protein [Gemmatimonadales bacterium]
MPYQDVVQLLARVMLSYMFLQSAYGHFTQVKPMGAYAKGAGVPLPEVAVVVTGFMLLGGGLSLLLGFHPRIGAGLLFVFLVVVAFWMHAFWRVTDPMQRGGQKAQFWKNITLAGAMLYIIANTGWPWPLAIG